MPTAAAGMEYRSRFEHSDCTSGAIFIDVWRHAKAHGKYQRESVRTIFTVPLRLILKYAINCVIIRGKVLRHCYKGLSKNEFGENYESLRGPDLMTGTLYVLAYDLFLEVFMDVQLLESTLRDIFGEKNVTHFSKGFRIIVDYDNMPYCVVLRLEGNKLEMDRDDIDRNETNYDEAFKTVYKTLLKNKERFDNQIDI